MSEWKECNLEEVAAPIKRAIISGPFGSNISSKFFTKTGIPVIRGNNLSLKIGIRFIDDNFVFISEEKAQELGTWAEEDDLVFTAAGTIGQVAIIQAGQKYEQYIISNKQLRVRLDKHKIVPLFGYYWFASPILIDTIMNNDTGSTIPLINLSVLKALPLLLPPIPEQKAIAGVLSSLDDKIDLLHRQNKTLEAMAETLFRQWFVEEADESWEEIKVSSLTNHIKINVIPSRNPTTIFNHFSIPSFDEGQNPKREPGKDILSNKYKVISNSVLVSKLNPRFPRIWAVGEDVEENSICSTEFQVFSPKEKRLFAFLFFLFKSEDAKKALIMSASGTSGSHQRVRPEDISNISILLPNIALAVKFSGITQNFLNKINQNQTQIRTLEKLRDTLLPKLMSGEVRVK